MLVVRVRNVREIWWREDQRCVPERARTRTGSAVGGGSASESGDRWSIDRI